MAKETVPSDVQRLAKRFSRDREVSLSCDYRAGTKGPNPSPQPLAPDLSCAACGWDMGRFLDQITRLTAGHLPQVGEKPEVREAGGEGAAAPVRERVFRFTPAM